MAKGNAIVMYLEQARIHGEPIGVTHSEVLFTKPNGYTVQPHNRVVSKADSKTMGESFLNELIYVLGAEDGEERKLPYDREVLVYTSDEINSDNYRTYINAVNTGINCPMLFCAGDGERLTQDNLVAIEQNSVKANVQKEGLLHRAKNRPIQESEIEKQESASSETESKTDVEDDEP